MNDDFSNTSEATLDDLDSDFAAAALAGSGPGNAAVASPASALMQAGRIMLDSALLRHLRQSRLLSQQDLADECWRRNIRVSIATIKRAESGHAVRFRIARELARCFDVPVMQILDNGVAVAS
jgi:DNA-binding XRE family transcriptional regulator